MTAIFRECPTPPPSRCSTYGFCTRHAVAVTALVYTRDQNGSREYWPRGWIDKCHRSK
jgi:hypothetical protein